MKEKIAVIAGGNSEEIVVSLKSGKVVMKYLQDHPKYEPYLAVIRKSDWAVEIGDERFPIDKDDFSFHKTGEHIAFDKAFIAIHGTPGEDGYLQGYLDLLGIAYTSPSLLNSALTFNKWYCNTLLKGIGIKVAPSILLRKSDKIDRDAICDELGCPCFVKPNNGGSSFGISKVNDKNNLVAAIKKAFERGDQVIVESFMKGTEVTCGIIPWEGSYKVLSPTEIVPEGEFFDYAAKYEGKSQEITPARISAELTKKVQDTVIFIYEKLNLDAMCRIDFIIQDEEPHVVEINTVPGLSEESIIPKQAAEAGIGLTDLFGALLDNLPELTYTEK
jgi:D-alanine-D-alanine ligase